MPHSSIFSVRTDILEFFNINLYLFLSTFKALRVAGVRYLLHILSLLLTLHFVILSLHYTREMFFLELVFSLLLLLYYIIVLGSKRQCGWLKKWFPIDLLGSPLHPADSVKNLGVYFDSNYSFSKHVLQFAKVLSLLCEIWRG